MPALLYQEPPTPTWRDTESMPEPEEYYVGVDVGTGSVRAVLVRGNGVPVASSTQDTITWRDPNDHNIFEQSTENIWSCIGVVVRSCLVTSGVKPEWVKGLGFDATCSLAVTDVEGRPVMVSRGDGLGKAGERNVVLWCDHRAEVEARKINLAQSSVLKYVGGTMSLEMEIPKILWLKNHMNPTFFSRCQFFDLPDYLTYRATGNVSRSACSLTCKCSYVPGSGWDAAFFEQIGLGEIVEGGYKQIGAENEGGLLTAGSPVGTGLSKEAASNLGLLEGTPVGSGLIDAYAGWLGTVAARSAEDGKLPNEAPTLEESAHRLAAVAGTSTCFLVQSPDPVYVEGVWGPYKDAVFKGWWMNEGGQSSTGQLIEHIITSHPAYPELVELAKEQDREIHITLQDILDKLCSENNARSLAELTKDLHIYPDFHGNRSPIADSRMRGSIVGLSLDTSILDLARKYYATLEAIAFQMRHIIEEMNARGHRIVSIYMSGGQAKNLLLMQLFANTCKMPVILPRSAGGQDSEAVVLGAAILGRFAAEVAFQKSIKADRASLLWAMMVEMTPEGTRIVPRLLPKEEQLLDMKYKIFRESIDIQRRWRLEVEQVLGE